ncbi:major facilitator superfamily MFS_1 [Methylocella silvestris BL2]|uniref:Major facilitator superfamily MFS_1 n=1 Tax=Methylocella silvestris (strain DSM 15510 / CIP 108128 / LMG 27833 / NCIMB 13906 / BL2) TaxID=395965 RepID=B8ET52_METSB|nr:MFS transporter [Methylocella silvestris]ACK51190.1 major facilitator superfamily MFS_1 [Methylocella silvestris BL2]
MSEEIRPRAAAAAVILPASDGFDAGDVFNRSKAVLTGSLGNLIEWYDIYAYSAFSLYFAGAFFPQTDPVAQQLAAASLFAAAFFVRPLGSALFGYFADRHGRRNALTAAVLLMCFGSLLIAATPTYAAIGVAAPIMLAIARLLQSLSQGGEYGSGATYLSEVAHPDRRGFYSGIWYVTLIGGQLLAILVLLILQKVFLTPEELKAWGWRIPFIIGALLSIFAFIIRRDMPETELFEAAKPAIKLENPWRLLLRNWKAVALVVGITVGGTSAFYTYTTYMQKFLKLSVGLNDSETTLVTAGTLIFALILQPLYGAISDKVGRRPMLIAFGVLGTLGTVPLLTTLQHTKSPLVAFLLICVAWAIVSGYTSIAAIVKAELFPTAIRAMGVGIPYALTVAIFGGSIDSVALAFKNAGFETGFFWYATGLIFISLICYIFMKDMKTHSKMEQSV